MGEADRDATRKALSKPAAFVVLSKGLALKTGLTAARLRELLQYNADTGAFTRLVSSSSSARAGCVAGGVCAGGYVQIHIDGKRYYAHRLAILYVKGTWPTDQVDHENGVRGDNRYANLRESTQCENMQNLAISPQNTSGYPGVTWNKAERKWQAQIKVGGKRKTLLRTHDVLAAAAAYLAAKAQIHTYSPVVRSA